MTNENKVLSLHTKLNNEIHKNYTMQNYEKNGYKYYFIRTAEIGQPRKNSLKIEQSYIFTK